MQGKLCQIGPFICIVSYRNQSASASHQIGGSAASLPNPLRLQGWNRLDLSGEVVVARCSSRKVLARVRLQMDPFQCYCFSQYNNHCNGSISVLLFFSA